MEENKNIEETLETEATTFAAEESTEAAAEEAEVKAEDTEAKAEEAEDQKEPQKEGGVMSGYVNTYIPSDEELAKRKKIEAFWDKVTTGLLIFLMASPFLIIGYIFYFFLTR